MNIFVGSLESLIGCRKILSLRDFESKLGNIWYGIVYSSDIRNFEDVELDRCIGSKVKKSWVRVDVKDKKYYEFGIFGCCC